MNLTEKLKNIYPELESFDFCSGSIRIENASDGKGDYIAKWEHPTLPKPTAEQLA